MLLFFVISLIPLALGATTPLKTVKELHVEARFSTWPEGNDANFETTIKSLTLDVGTEGTDRDITKIAVTSIFNGTSETNIYDLKMQTWLNVNGFVCSSRSLKDRLTGDPFFPFNASLPMLQSVESLFYLDGDVSRMNNTYTTTNKVFFDENGKKLSCRVDTVFSGNEALSYWCHQEQCFIVPLRSEISCGDNETSFQYQFFNYYDDQVSQKPFQVNEFTYCDQEKSTPFPKFTPYARFVSLQNVVEDEPITEMRRVWYDSDLKIYRQDLSDDSSDDTSDMSNPTKETSRIYDYNTRIIYSVDRSDFSCSKTKMEKDDKMPKLEKLLFDIDPNDYDFQPVGDGFDNCRLTNCKLMVGRSKAKDNTKQIVNLYYDPTHEFRKQGDINVTTAVNPVSFKSITQEGNTEDGKLVKEIHNFEIFNDDWSVFDISLCKQEFEKRDLLFMFTADRPVPNNNDGIHDEFRKAFKSSFQITQPLRFNRIKVTPAGGNNINVSMVLFNPEGNGGKSSDDLVKDIQSAVNEKKFMFKNQFLNDQKNATIIIQFNATQLILGSVIPEPKITVVNKGYTSGDMAGLAFGMIFLGAIVGVVGFVFYTRRQGYSRN